MPVEMEVARVLASDTQDLHFVELREVGSSGAAPSRTFPIVIGHAEASAVRRRLLGEASPRPQTHDLLGDVIHTLGFEIQCIEITELHEHTFFARLCLRSSSDPQHRVDVDARPSDAIALGAASQVPIFVDEGVLAVACPPDEPA